MNTPKDSSTSGSKIEESAKIKESPKIDEIKLKAFENTVEDKTDLETKLLNLKRKSVYMEEDIIIKSIVLSNDVVVRFIANNRGYFIDFRKYYKGFPTKKGIRVLANKFREASELLKPDLDKYLPDIKIINNN